MDHYEKFLSLWKDAALGIAEVEDTKKRLAGLKGQQGMQRFILNPFYDAVKDVGQVKANVELENQFEF